jgi:hypothetical protein
MRLTNDNSAVGGVQDAGEGEMTDLDQSDMLTSPQPREAKMLKGAPLLERRPLVRIENCRIRYCPKPEHDAGLQFNDADGTSELVGVIVFGSGWQMIPETPCIDGNIFERDDSLPPGTVLIEP